MADNHYKRLWNKFYNAIPEDACGQYSLADFIKEQIPHKVASLLDLGCGNGRWADSLINYCDRYIGVDVPDSPESSQRNREDFEFRHYDGINIPCEDDSVDLVFSNQLLERVLEPHRLFPQIHRILKKDGLFIGSVSHLEPFHSYSVFNYTPFGFSSFCDLFGLDIVCLRPGMDSLTLIERNINKIIIGRGSEMEDSFWNAESPLNYQLEKLLRRRKEGNKAINLTKLNVSGQFCFAAKKRSA